MASGTKEEVQENVNVREQAVKMMEERLDFLRPLRDEAVDIEQTLNAIKGQGRDGTASADTPTPVRRGRPRRSENGEPTGRAKQFLDYVREHPGATVSQIAEGMKLKQANYGYRIKNTLLSEGRIRQEGKGFVAVEQ